MSFTTDITRFIAKTGLKADVVVRKLAFDMLLGIQKRSPVDTGRFRHSHRISINRVDPSVSPAKNKKGKKILYPTPQIKLPVGVKFGDTVYITNNLPYAQALEGGHSKQAPGKDAIFGATFREVVDKFHKTVAGVKNL